MRIIRAASPARWSTARRGDEPRPCAAPGALDRAGRRRAATGRRPAARRRRRPCRGAARGATGSGRRAARRRARRADGRSASAGRRRAARRSAERPQAPADRRPRRTSAPGRRPATGGTSASPKRSSAARSASRCASVGAPRTVAVIVTPSRRGDGDLRPARVVRVPGLAADEARARRRSGCRSTRPRARRRAWRVAAAGVPADERVARALRGGAAALSRAVETWPGWSSPCGLRYVRPREPERARRGVHPRDEARRPSRRPRAAASAVAASFALGTSVPISRSRDGDALPGAEGESVDSPTRAAAAGTVTTSSSATRAAGDERGHQLRDARHRARRRPAAGPRASTRRRSSATT